MGRSTIFLFFVRTGFLIGRGHQPEFMPEAGEHIIRLVREATFYRIKTLVGNRLRHKNSNSLDIEREYSSVRGTGRGYEC